MTTRIAITRTTLKGPFVALQPTANSLDVTFEAASVADKNYFAPSGDDVLLAWNTHGANPYTITITSTPDLCNRTGDITAYTLQAGEVAAFRIKHDGWRETDGYIYFEANNAAIKFAVLGL